MDSARLRQTAIAILIFVVIATLWYREAPVDRAAPEGARSGSARFDYYVLVLSWSPTHCASEEGGGADDRLQCRSGRAYGFVLHGLWPQFERGYPQDCPSDEPRIVSDALMTEMLAYTPSERLVQHEWEKHGACSGLSQRAYFAAATNAFRSIAIPAPYRVPTRALETTADEVRAAFVRANARLATETLSATCRGEELKEVWVCLDRDLSPRACANEVRKRHCGGRRLRMRAVRGDRRT
jgi:ribonuclease T2